VEELQEVRLAKARCPECVLIFIEPVLDLGLESRRSVHRLYFVVNVDASQRRRARLLCRPR